jgi:integrase
MHAERRPRLPRESADEDQCWQRCGASEIADDARVIDGLPMGRGDLTTHGFRSTFRDRVAERKDFPREVAEAALAHIVSNQVEAAYWRGDLFEKRRKLMDAWNAYCVPVPAISRIT